MKKLIVVSGAVAMALAVTMGVAQSQSSSGKTTDKGVVYASADKATFRGRLPGVSMAVLWGDPDKGAHATLTKFIPGYDAGGMHSHTSDLTLVVIKGAYLYKDAAGEKRVGAGEVLRIPGGHKHWSGGDKTEGALFFEEGSGKFDKIDVK